MLAASLELERQKDYQSGRDDERRASLQRMILELLDFHFALSPEDQIPLVQ